VKTRKQLKEDWNDLECVRDMFTSSMHWVNDLKKGVSLYRIALIISLLTNLSYIIRGL
jgi:hypothetical protein